MQKEELLMNDRILIHPKQHRDVPRERKSFELKSVIE